MAAVGVGVVGVGVAVADVPAGASGSLVITSDGAVVEGRSVNGYIHIKASNVTIRNVTVEYDGDHAIRVFNGFSGAVVEDVKIYCTAAKTNGLVFGNYTARRVLINGCRSGFTYSESAPATIIDSAWNGTAVTVSTEGQSPVDVAAPSSTATTGAAPRGQQQYIAGSASRQSNLTVVSSTPGPDNTGVPAGTPLRASGSLEVKQDGQVITGLNVSGCVTVAAKNVIIRKSRITCATAPYAIRTIDAENLLVEDVEIDGRGRTEVAVCCGNYTLRRVEITNVIDGPRLGDNSVVENSWVHHLARVGASHNDTLQTTGASNIVVRGNRLDAYNPTTRDPMNACLMIGSTTAPLVENLIFEDNYCNGGNYSIGVRTDLRATNIRLIGNVFGRNYRYGVVARPEQTGLTWEKATNVYADNQKPVVP